MLNAALNTEWLLSVRLQYLLDNYNLEVLNFENKVANF